LMRRRFEVSAFQGLWSVVDGLQDLVVVPNPSTKVNDTDLEYVNVLEEIVEETGYQVEMISKIEKIGNLVQPNPSKDWQVYNLSVFYAQLKADITPPVTLSYEHFGAVWANVSAVRNFLFSKKNCCYCEPNLVLDQVLRDKTAPNIPQILSMLVQAI
jgi:hypothetical protein